MKKAGKLESDDARRRKRKELKAQR